MISSYLKVVGILLLFCFVVACEQEFIPEVIGDPDQIVVEGYIEAGERPAPPFVILTRSIPFFSEISAEQLEDIFVRDALVQVSDGTDTIRLTLVCLEDLNEFQSQIAGQFFGFNPDSIGFNFCAYVDLSFSMLGEEGKTYSLEVAVDGKRLFSVATIPNHVPMDSIRFVPPPGDPVDTLAQLRGFITDPADKINYYRYFTEINQEGFLSPFTSVSDDRLFNGQSFEFPLPKAEQPTEEFDPETFGLYRVGDTVSIRWVTFDESQFNFWNTLEFNRANQGPFSSYTRVSSNVEGGLGVWGPFSASYYTTEVEY